MLTQKELMELLEYEPGTGVFTWRSRAANCVRIGAIAGSAYKSGYKRIALRGRSYMSHRLAWLYMTGAFPTLDIDHVNGDKGDNRFRNLRLADDSQNQQNQRRPHADGTSGFLGVCFNKMAGKWQAGIKVDGSVKHLGLFNCPTAAYLLGYLPAKRSLHEFGTL